MNGDRRPKPNPRRKFADARFETCKVCGLEWNISIKAAIDWHGYTCPRCRGSKRKER